MKRVIISLFVILLLLLGIGYIAISSIQIKRDSLENTRAIEEILRESHEKTAVSAIYRFETTWMSLDAYRNPEVQARVATGPFLEQMRFKQEVGSFNTLEYWQVTKAVTITSVSVYEFTPTKFRTGACVNRNMDRVTPQGVFLESVTHQGVCIIYVFIWEQNNWMLAGAFNTTMRDTAARDWHQLPDWLKEIIGELPSNLP